MKRRNALALSSALLAGAIAGCTGGRRPGDGDPSGPRETPDVDETQLAELVRGTNSLAFDLYGELVSATPDENLLASPVSITTALAMAYAGARGETRSQMREALQYTLDDERLHAAFNALQRDLNSRGEKLDEEDLPANYEPEDEPVPFQLNMVNAVWGQEGYPFEDDYLGLLEDDYGGGLREVDYSSDPEAARKEINAWVAEQTEDRIEDLLPEGSLSTLTRLVLTNAIYFLANWHSPFDENATSDAPFTTLDGSTVDVPMMSQQTTVPYAEKSGAKAVELPYLGEEVSMLVILPPEDRFEAYERSFDATRLEQIVGELRVQEGNVSLPGFEFESELALRNALETLGMPGAFDPSAADFSGIADRDQTSGSLYIDDVYHDAYIRVDEEGTEAAAATGVVVGTTSAATDLFELVADRPFLFAVRDRPTDTVLFLGRMVDAGAAR